jgi:hypothetical protein
MPRDTTMLELVNTLSGHSHNEDEVVARVVTLVNSGTVRLCGIFKGSRFEASIGEPSWQSANATTSTEVGAR